MSREVFLPLKPTFEELVLTFDTNVEHNMQLPQPLRRHFLHNLEQFFLDWASEINSSASNQE